MGRPPIGKVAMTVAERVRRYRLKHPDKPVTNKLAAAKAEIAALKQELAQAKSEIAALKAELQALRDGRQAKAGTDANAEIAMLKHYIAEIEQQRDAALADKTHLTKDAGRRSPRHC
jgi:chromosome segregation ATPase